MDVSTVFFLVGSIIFIGFLGTLFFQRTKVPDVLLLMVLGMFIGPVFHIIEPTSLESLSTYFAALALIILLFEGGLGLNIFKVIREIPKATGFTVLIFLFTILITGALMSVFFQWSVYQGILLGAVIGGSSSAIVIGILNKIKTADSVKTLLTLESTLTDVLCIVVSISMIQVILSSSLNFAVIGNSLLGAFSIAAVVAVAFGMVWLQFLKNFGGFEYGYLLTLAVTFLLYAFVESIKANGAVAALVFGLMLANAKDIALMLRLKGDYTVNRDIIRFHKEISFFVRTFFFVFIGIAIDIKSILDVTFVVMGVSVVVGLVAARRLGVYIYGMFSENVSKFSPVLNAMMPRGLAAAVLASIPMSSGIEISGFVEIVFFVIIATNLITTVSVYRSQASVPEKSEKSK
ncbi:MAG: cation:proton antiporter [archaeon]